MGEPTDEQEKIVAMMAEINSLKKNAEAQLTRPTSPQQGKRNQWPRKRRSRRKRKTPQRRRPQISGHGRTSLPRIMTARRTTHLVHVMVIQGAYLIPYSATRILSLQHLAQQANNHYPREEGTGALTTSKNITLFWSQHRFAKTVLLDPRTNVGLTMTASGARSYRAFCTSIDAEETNQTNIFTTHMILEDEDDESFQPRDLVDPPAPDEEDPVTSPEQSHEASDQGLKTTPVDLGPISHVIPEDLEPTSLDPHDDLLRWHYCLGHLPLDWVKQLAQTGQLPKRLLASKKPFCAACQYGKMTRRPWRFKGDNKMTEFRQPIQVQSHLEKTGILVQLGRIQRT